MKKYLSTIAMVALALMATSCGDDNKEPNQPVEPIQGSSFESDALTFGNNKLGEGDYKFTVSNDGSKMDIYYAENGKIPTNPQFHNVALTAKGNGIYSFVTSSTDGTGYIDNVNETFLFEHALGNGKVTVTSDKILSALADGATNYASTTQRYYEIEFDHEDNGTITADLYIHNIQFVPAMPVISKIGIKGLTVGAYGASLSAAEVTPYFYEGGQEIPMPSRKVTNFTMNLNWNNSADCYVQFDCFGLTFKDSFKTEFTQFIKK